MNRFRILLPAITSASAGLGALMYAGTTGYDCVGRYNNRSVAHPPLAWPWYIAVVTVAVCISLVPFLPGSERRRAARQTGRQGRYYLATTQPSRGTLRGDWRP